jgi:hypothetical protein
MDGGIGRSKAGPGGKPFGSRRVIIRLCSAFRSFTMLFHSVLITPLVALLAGILILIVPRLLNLIVALYLILIGVLGLAPHFLH